MENIDDYVEVSLKQLEQLENKWKEKGLNLIDRIYTQNKQYGYNIASEEEWFALGGQIFVMVHGGAIRKQLHNNQEKKSSFHRHDFFEMNYVYRGTLCNIVEKEEIIQPEHTLMLLSPRAKHLTKVSNSDDIVFNILMKKSLVESVFLNLFSELELGYRFFCDSLYNINQQQPFMVFQCNNRLVDLIHTIIQEYFEQNDYYHSVITAKLIELFSLISRIQYSEDTSKVKLRDTPYNLITEIRQYINTNYSTVTLTELSRYFNYTPSNLSKMIQMYYHQSFSSMLRDIRLRNACHYLTHSNLPIDQVIEQVGYTDISYFYRSFKQKYNVAPNQYRKQFRSKNSDRLFV